MASDCPTAWKLHQALHQLCKNNATCSSVLNKFLCKQIWTTNDRDELLTALADLFWRGSDNLLDVCVWLGPLVLEVASRQTQSILRGGKASQHLLKKWAVTMSMGFPVSPVLQRFALDFVQRQKPFSSKNTSCDEPPAKKAKKKKISDVDFCLAMWNYMVYTPQAADQLDIKQLLSHLSNPDILARWYASCGLSKYYNMSESETSTFLHKYFSLEEQRELTIRVNRRSLEVQHKFSQAQGLLEVQYLESSLSHTLQAVTSSDLSSTVVSVMGVLLPRVDSPAAQDSEASSPLVMVESSQQHLRSLALAVSCCRPILLQGPVGCGKTCLVQHLAYLSGRLGYPDFIKIQLGDQTDSKALLGTYCSTPVPGEFVWRAGALSQAVARGSWILLEDVDTAAMDVVSLLVALAETRSLVVPGHSDVIRAAPGFQLFVTQRLLSSSQGLHHKQGGHTALLDKLCSVINVEPLSRCELKQVISARFPSLVPVVDKLLDIYLLLSTGRHDTGDGRPMFGSSSQNFLTIGGRHVSTRDLMTWCSRSSVDFNHKDSSQGLRVFLEGVDCFVSCLHHNTQRLSVAAALAAGLNLPEERSKYFCTDYKPTIHESATCLEIGRVKLQRKNQTGASHSRSRPTFSYTRASLVLLEKIAVCVYRNEPVLLSGETGTGKTSTVQFLAHYLGNKLHVINLNQQSDSTDLLGGFRPVDVKFVILPLREEFEKLFCEVFSRSQNQKFLSHIQVLYSKKRWKDLLSLIEVPVNKALEKCAPGTESWERWGRLSLQISELRVQIPEMEKALAFTFLEGTLVKALQNGDWVLLDEINLATAETLECLSGLLESTAGSVVLTERGDSKPIKRHPEFRLFACMNPATDVGKKDLPVGIRNRFTEFYVEELDSATDLSILVRDYLPGLSLTSKQVSGIVNFYLAIKHDPKESLTDGTGRKPHFSLRTLCRALMYSSRNVCRSVPRSLFEGFCLSFLTQLDRSSHPIVENLIYKHILPNTAPKAILGHKLPRPDGGEFVPVADYWVSVGYLKPVVPTDYILTPSVKMNLRDLARVVSAGKYAVLLQGETSVGKTSLINYLARLTGNVCLRVNNHEHTDLQEYIGSYTADGQGRLVFQDGVLVEAMRRGHWIILDELNLAPSDVLEALNRLLDDNQELYIPETQEVVQAHPKFMLFATQNPPGHYGGRKVLSRAFRNRFVELHFDEIPASELETILHEKSDIPLSYAKKLVAVMLELQTRRRSSGIFSGKHGFMTLRDLFRWAQRYQCPQAGRGGKFYDWDQHLAEHGYLLLAGRVRRTEEEQVIKEVIEKHLKRVLHSEALFSITDQTPAPLASMLNGIMGQSLPWSNTIVWTYSMRRLAVLIGQAIEFKEPVLLVGDTGVGKTTVCQLYAALKGRCLLSINCHMHTESADFLGGLRPVRTHAEAAEGEKSLLFEWKDGPLVTAMKEGAMFLIDEISLADDSVLERLNSILEPEQTILLAEKGGGLGDLDVVNLSAADGFQVLATMNPGGDFGKKELSPALRNRFTEIWCPQLFDRNDLIAIVEKNIQSGLTLYQAPDGTSGFGPAILDFLEWFISSEAGRRATTSIRDILSWVDFINTCSACPDSMDTDESAPKLDPVVAYVHGACLVFIDGLGAGSTSFSTEDDTRKMRQLCFHFLTQQLSSLLNGQFDLCRCQLMLPLASDQIQEVTVALTDQTLCIPPFQISREPAADSPCHQFTLEAPTTCVNAQRLLRGLQLPRPILLEGSPGVGKTSLVAAVARLAGRTLVRINLSDQTDVTDLFGADLPVEGEEGGRFAWRDGPFLQALKSGHWVVFDELNLASQSVLEGLNACFDHRAEVYIPELGKTFHIKHQQTRIFACQNPFSQGGGRKGLPRSFLNRFTQVHVDPLTDGDLLLITSATYPTIPREMLTTMVTFNNKMQKEIMIKKSWGLKGSPWEFNLRDLFRWCDLLQADQQTASSLNPGSYVGLIYKNRMRTLADKIKVEELYVATFDPKWPLVQPSRKVYFSPSMVQAGHSFLPRTGERGSRLGASTRCLPLHHSLEPLESLMKCVQMGWMTILVGPQSSGKTSLVRLLAEMTGRQLAVLPMSSSMDTTELLGGFEQSDVWRHLSVITKMLDTEMTCLGKLCLLQEQPVQLAEFESLLQARVQYRHLPTSNEGLSFQDTILLLTKHVTQLHSLVRYLDRMGLTSAEHLSELKQQVSQLSHAVADTKPGAGGGTFEWVDSLLVQALKTGQWLLVDNVNFCSAAVLDRLNALLEPRGILSINERGTVNGEMVTVTPHTDFRLFFCMDPAHGEISRAMRNRGVEMYLPGESEGAPYSCADVAAMMEQAGLQLASLQNWLMTLHSSLQSGLPHSERPVIADLLLAATLCAQFLSCGFSLKEAAGHSARDVYVSTRRLTSTRQIAKDLLVQHLMELANGQSSPALSLRSVTRSSPGQFRQLQTIKQDARLMITLLEEIFHEPRLASCRSWRLQLQTSALIFSSHQTESGWRLAGDWLLSTGHHILSGALAAPADCQSVVNWWTGLTCSCLTQLFESAAMGQLRRAVESVFGSSETALQMLRDQAWDLTLNPEAINHYLLLLDRKTQSVETLGMADLELALKRLELIQLCVVIAVRLKEQVKTLEQIISCGKKMQHHSTLVLVSLLMSFISENLPQLVSDLDRDNLESLSEVSYSLQWLPRLVEAAALSRSRHPELVLAQLSLHWHWLQDKLAGLLALSQSQNPRISLVVQELLSKLGRLDKSVKRYAQFWQAFGHPTAFLTLQEAELSQTFRELVAIFTCSQSDSPTSLSQKVAVFIQTGACLNNLVTAAHQSLTSGRYAEAEKDLISLRAYLKEHGLAQTSQTLNFTDKISTDRSLDVTDTPITDRSPVGLKHPCQLVHLWPLFGHLSLLASLRTLIDSWAIALDASRCTPDISANRHKELEDLSFFNVNHIPFSADIVSSLRVGNKESRVGAVEQVLSQLWLSPACLQYKQWLQWPAEGRTLPAGWGPGVLMSAPVSLSAAHLLPSSMDLSIGQLVPTQVSLGSLEIHTQEVLLLSRHIWCHSSTFSSPLYDVRILQQQLLWLSFLQVLQATPAWLSSQDRPAMTLLLAQLSTGSATPLAVTGLQDLVVSLCQQLPTEVSSLLLPSWQAVSAAVLEVDLAKSVALVGHGLVCVGLLLARVLAPCGPVDPVEKAKLKLKYVSDELEDTEAELSAWDKHLVLTTGRNTKDTHRQHLHPRICAQMKRRDALLAAKAKLEQYSAYRPDHLQYTQVKGLISTFLENSCCWSRVWQLLLKLETGSGAEGSLTRSLQEERVWQETSDRFLQQLQDNFQCYRDLVTPFCLAVQEIKLGLRMVAQDVHKRSVSPQLGLDRSLVSVVTILCTFPSLGELAPNLLSLADLMTGSSLLEAVTKVLSCSHEGLETGLELLPQAKSRLFLCALLLLQAHCICMGTMNEKVMSSLTGVLGLFHTAWSQQEERRKLEEAEKSALFKYKQQTHGDSRSESEREEAEFRAAFPSFDKDFIDVTGANRLEDVGQECQDHMPAAVVSLEAVSGLEMARVCAAHVHMLTNFTQAHWLVKSGQDCPIDLATPCLLSYQIGAELVKVAYNVLDPETDQQILGSHLVAAGMVLKYINPHTVQNQLDASSSSYNIYLDPNIPQVNKCKSTINSLRARVSQLQQEWPDHPTFLLLNKIMDRILSFSVSSPVVKFLTGLELLLQTAQDWESNAASYVSLANELKEITSIIVEWRKLELSCWQSALDHEEEKCRRGASQWWFHLYQITSSYLASGGSSFTASSGPSHDQLSILETLKKFMESSTLGEFSVRLEMLLAFHCQMLHMESSPAQRQLCHLLWNLHQFYHQFLAQLQAELRNLRAPIHKQLKGFIKIARWSDMNYWALKTSTEKTHKTVHKFIKEYQNVLKQPVSHLLGDRGQELVAEAVQELAVPSLQDKLSGWTQQLLALLVPSGPTDCPQEKFFCLAASFKLPLLSRLPSLCQKMKLHLSNHLKQSELISLVLSFDDLTGELIEEIHELQQLKVDLSAPKQKQKTEAKSINLRKRKGLSELFKCLAKIGLSYRKGVTQKAALNWDSALELPPLNLKIHPKVAASQLWDGCQQYFYRCISRSTQFSAASISPSQELTMADCERTRGYVGHFCQLYIEQRARLTTLASQCLDLRSLLDWLQHVSREDYLPPHSESQTWLNRVKDLTTQLNEGLLQFSLVLESCPGSSQNLSMAPVYPSPLPANKLAASALWSTGDEGWSQCLNTIQAIRKQVLDQQSSLTKFQEQPLITRLDLNLLVQALDVYSSLTPQLAAVSQQFVDHSSNSSGLVSCLLYLSDQILTTGDQFNQWLTHLPNPESPDIHEATYGTEDATLDIGELTQKIEGLVQAVLLSIQQEVTASQTPSEEEFVETAQGHLKEGLLTTHLLDMEKSSLKRLNASEIVARLGAVITSLQSMSEGTHGIQRTGQSLGLLQLVTPVVTGFTTLMEAQLGQSVCLHRSMGKLLSVLLALFTELSQKGFCIPPELSEELAGEGATDFQDTEGGGLGEGQGCKDVSDQIETEDQLEEAKKPGAQDPADQEDQAELPAEENAIEMSDDFQGKIHDLDDADGDKEDNKDEQKEDEDMERQMGDVGGDTQECLDERMWGSDEEEDNGSEETLKEDQASGGMDKQKQELVAKDDQCPSEAQDDTEHDLPQDHSEENQPDVQDDEDYDDNQVTDHNEDRKEPDMCDLELAEDLHLDDGEKHTEEAETEKVDEAGEDNGHNEAPQDPESVEPDPEIPAQELESNPEAADNMDTTEEPQLADTDTPADADTQTADIGDPDQPTDKDEEKVTGELSRQEQDVPEQQDQVDSSSEAKDVNLQADAADSLGAGSEQKEAQQEQAVRDDRQLTQEEVGGNAASQDQQGHQGHQSSQVAAASAETQQLTQRKPGHSDSDRSLGSRDQQHQKLKTRDVSDSNSQQQQQQQQSSIEFQHIKDAQSDYDAQTIDVATADQMTHKQAVPEQVEDNKQVADNEEVNMQEEEDILNMDNRPETKANRSREQHQNTETPASPEEGQEAASQAEAQVAGDRVLTLSADRPPDSSIHTALEHLHLGALQQEIDVEAMRQELEECVPHWSDPTYQTPSEAAAEAWHKYQVVTSTLSQELCEQLRLILEPSQATKLRGDYRTGKRLNMRRVITYIASQFRKDKIWLRRSKPSKRQYQIMLAVDDSSSMADNHSRQLAFESLALVSNALTLLEAGELAVCSFGEEVKLLHPFSETFTSISGARVLQQLTCQQKQTKYGVLLDKTLAMLTQAGSLTSPATGHLETAQLLLVLSDGNGVFREGMDVVRRAVRRARAAKIFLVFIILDNPERKSSVLDAKVPILDASGQIQEIKSYMEMFPFPFYLILRDINSLPLILSDALRQWFELVISADR